MSSFVKVWGEDSCDVYMHSVLVVQAHDSSVFKADVGQLFLSIFVV